MSKDVIYAWAEFDDQWLRGFLFAKEPQVGKWTPRKFCHDLKKQITEATAGKSALPIRVSVETRRYRMKPFCFGAYRSGSDPRTPKGANMRAVNKIVRDEVRKYLTEGW